MLVVCGVVAARCCGGRFPANASHPPGGHVKQKHARTHSCYHPRPVKPRVHERPGGGVRPAVPAGQGSGRGTATLKKVKSKPKPAAKEKTQTNRLPSRVRVGQNARLEKILNLMEV